MSVHSITTVDLKVESEIIDNKLKEQEDNLRDLIIRTDKEIKNEEEKKRLAALEGDLRENAGYQTATENLARLHVEMRNLYAKEKAFKDFSIDYEPSGFIGLGTTVNLEYKDTKTKRSLTKVLKLVPSDLGDSLIRAVSIESPVGKVLRGKSVNDTVVVRTQARTTVYTILEVY